MIETFSPEITFFGSISTFLLSTRQLLLYDAKSKINE
jgi:hypothetical protein